MQNQVKLGQADVNFFFDDFKSCYIVVYMVVDYNYSSPQWNNWKWKDEFNLIFY